MSVKHFINVVALAAVTGLSASIASATITIPTVPIGNAGNAPEPLTGLGSVAYTYNIGQTEVTNAQYAAFLNAKAASDPLALYSPGMSSPRGGIARSGSPGSYTYSTVPGRENNPVNFVSFWDAARFANWLHNGQGNADTETGAYTLTPDTIANNTVVRNAGWQWALPSVDEWYKAAFHQPADQGGDVDSFWRYTTMSNNAPTFAQVNYEDVINNTTPVGSYAPNFYGTFDMGGNVSEWTDSSSASTRFFAGGSFTSNVSDIGGTSLGRQNADFEILTTGFRLVQIPGPGAAALLGLGGLLASRRHR